VAVVALGIGLGQRGGILQHDLQQVGGGGLGPDRAAEALCHEARQPATVIDVGVAQDHRIEQGGIERESVEIARLGLATALDHAAVEQYAMSRRFDFVQRAGDLAGGAMETDPHDQAPRRVMSAM
jgi:hypothetical protein